MNFDTAANQNQRMILIDDIMIRALREPLYKEPELENQRKLLYVTYLANMEEG